MPSPKRQIPESITHPLWQELDEALRAVLLDFITKYQKDEVRSRAAQSLCVPAMCIIIMELGEAVQPEMRAEWAEQLYQTAEQLAAPGTETADA